MLGIFFCILRQLAVVVAVAVVVVVPHICIPYADAILAMLGIDTRFEAVVSGRSDVGAKVADVINCLLGCAAMNSRAPRFSVIFSLGRERAVEYPDITSFSLSKKRRSGC